MHNTFQVNIKTNVKISFCVLEQADVEYEIRTLMAKPDQNKTDSDKAKEEALIARLVEIVTLRNEVVDCLDRDRLREREEDFVSNERFKNTSKLMKIFHILNLTIFYVKMNQFSFSNM